MTIKETHDWLDFIMDKVQTRYYSPEQKDDALHRAQLGVFATYHAAYLQDGYTHDALRPFRKESSGATNGAGLYTYPGDFAFATGVRCTYFDNTTQSNIETGFKIYKDDEIGEALRSHIRPVTVTRPIGNYRDTGIQMYPRNNVYTITLLYVSKPEKPVYAYTTSGDEDIHDPLTSTDMQWDDIYMMPVMLKALEYLGVNSNDPIVLQYAAEKTNQLQGPIKS